MNLSRRNFMKIAGLSAAAVAGAALFTGCSGSGQLMLARPVFCYRDR